MRIQETFIYSKKVQQASKTCSMKVILWSAFLSYGNITVSVLENKKTLVKEIRLSITWVKLLSFSNLMLQTLLSGCTGLHFCRQRCHILI
jgi:hypothetical protein